jgi:hypothetical protein
MGTELNFAKLIPGRTMEIDTAGRMTAASRKYRVLRDFGAPLAAENISTVTGLPALASAHPDDAELRVDGAQLAGNDGCGLALTGRAGAVYLVASQAGQVVDWSAN